LFRADYFDIGKRLLGTNSGVGYAYDGHGRRTEIQHADGSRRVQMYSSQGRLMYGLHLAPPGIVAEGRNLYFYIQDRLVAEYRPDAAQDWLQYVHTDTLGTPVVRSNLAAQEIADSRRWYEPYGFTQWYPASSGVGYTGHFFDRDTELVYMQQRYYDPITGRFLSVDPVVTNASNGSFFNRYEYARNNPYKFKDPDGRSPAHGFLIGAGLELTVQVLQFASDSRDGISLGDVMISGVAGAAGVGLAGKFGQLGGLLADAATSAISSAAKGHPVTALGVAADVGLGKLGSAAAKPVIKSGPDYKVGERQAGRLERIGNKEGARPAQRERAESARPNLEKGVEQQAAKAGVVASGAGSAVVNSTEEKPK
jgi:RHS repeat-associated protein